MTKLYLAEALDFLKENKFFLGLWVLWCFGHSLLLTEKIRQNLEKKRFFKRWGRLCFNLFSLITLAPLVFWTYWLNGPLVFKWPLWLWPLRLALFLWAFYLMVSAFKVYGFWSFLGLREESPVLKRSGILSKLRHPLYTAGFILLWIRDQSLAWFWVDLILSLYLFIGTKLEEKKLERIFPEYKDYKREVPGFWPRLKRPI